MQVEMDRARQINDTCPNFWSFQVGLSYLDRVFSASFDLKWQVSEVTFWPITSYINSSRIEQSVLSYSLWSQFVVKLLSMYFPHSLWSQFSVKIQSVHFPHSLWIFLLVCAFSLYSVVALWSQ
jgi:hypothetical protein